MYIEWLDGWGGWVGWVVLWLGIRNNVCGGWMKLIIHCLELV